MSNIKLIPLVQINLTSSLCEIEIRMAKNILEILVFEMNKQRCLQVDRIDRKNSNHLSNQVFFIKWTNKRSRCY